jgi:hypothetical protein
MKWRKVMAGYAGGPEEGPIKKGGRMPGKDREPGLIILKGDERWKSM